MTATRIRTVKEISFLILCFFAIWSVRATYLYAIDESIPSDAQRLVYSTLVKSVLWVGSAFAFVYWVRQVSPFPYLGLSAWPSARQWLVSLALTGLFLSLTIGFEAVIGRKAFSTVAIPFFFTIPGLLFTFVSPLVEEILFRGLFLKELAALFPPWRANLLTSLLFVGIHLPFWLTHGGLSWALLNNMAGVFLFSLVAGWLYLRTSSILPATLAHIANNCVAALLVVQF